MIFQQISIRRDVLICVPWVFIQILYEGRLQFSKTKNNPVRAEVVSVFYFTQSQANYG